jgi:hypothetical protein
LLGYAVVYHTPCIQQAVHYHPFGEFFHSDDIKLVLVRRGISTVSAHSHSTHTHSASAAHTTTPTKDPSARIAQSRGRTNARPPSATRLCAPRSDSPTRRSMHRHQGYRSRGRQTHRTQAQARQHLPSPPSRRAKSNTSSQCYATTRRLGWKQ